MHSISRHAVALLAGCAFALPIAAHAQQADTMIVLDGSGSMWGQIEGRTKIEIARETLSSVLSETERGMNLGMIAYGHRQKGVCSDIETVVPIAPATQSVPSMISVANNLKPKGKTPLSDAVRKAAEELRYTENAATVVLVTDGIETCDADPCALANELEQFGINFTAHVVGFGLSRDEGRQVACLAENTGGKYISADNADELSDALSDTIRTAALIPDDSDFEDDGPVPRNVQFMFRDTDDGPTLTTRNVEITFESEEGLQPLDGTFRTVYSEYTADGRFNPGAYTAVISRLGEGGYTARYPFEVVEGPGVQLVDASLGGSLTVNVFLNPNEPYDPKDPPVAAVKSTASVALGIYQQNDDGSLGEKVVDFWADTKTRPLPAGNYIIRGTIDRTATAEQAFEVAAGTPTELDFSLNVTRVYLDARQTDGSPVERQTTYWYDKVPSGRNYWRSGHGGSQSTGQVKPFYLPVGQWVVNVGGEGYGKRRSERLINVPGDFREIRLEVGEGEQLSEADQAFLNGASYSGCTEITGERHSACLVKASATGTGGGTDDRPDEVADITGEQYTFSYGGSPGLIIVTRPTEATRQAIVELRNGWCGIGCPGAKLEVPQERLALLAEDGFRASSFSAGGYDFGLSSFGADKELIVTQAGLSPVIFQQVK